VDKVEGSGQPATPDLDNLLAGLTEAQLRRVIRTMVEDEPTLAPDIERTVQWLRADPAAAEDQTGQSARAITVDIAAISREMDKDFRHIAASGGGYGDQYWDDEAGLFDPEEVLEPHRGLASRLLDAGDAAAATRVLTALIEAWAEGIAGLDDWIRDANVDPIWEAALDLGTLLAEALLSQDLSEEQRAQWLARVQDWGEDWEDDLGRLEIVETALQQGWDYPPLLATMQGHITEEGAWEGEAPDFADELTLARLRILERQGRMQEYIHLAEAEGQTGLYVNMLARSGQVERAKVEARQFIASPAEIQSLAEVLVADGERAAALDVAAQGLDLTEPRGRRELARWTVAEARKADDSSLALRAARVAFLSGFALDDYKIAEDVAGDQWSVVMAALLEQVAESTFYGKVDIYLYEHMLAEAMAAFDRGPFSGDLDRVIQATRAEFPDWGIRKCQRQAESTMDAGKANAYDRAIAWLRLARDIFDQHDRQAEWEAYLTRLLDLHARKYKLVPMLRGIG